MNTTPQSTAPEPVSPPSTLSATPTTPAASETPATPAAPSTDPAAPKTTEGQAAPLSAADIKLPDGFTVDEAIMTPFVELVNKYNIPREAVDAFVDLQAKATQKNSEASSLAWADMQKQWTDEIAADPDLSGQAWDTKHAPAIGQMLDKYGSPDVRAALDLTGAGNNPHVVRMFAKLAAAVTEPGFVPAPAPADGQSSVESRIYPTMK
jgi:hypothetical protein